MSSPRRTKRRGGRPALLALALASVVLVIAVEWLQREPGETVHRPAGDGRITQPAADDAGVDRIARAFQARESGVVVESAGVVTRLLADDNEGSRHQRFIVELEGGHTLLISHNIDLARRTPVSEGDRIEFRGQYEWNERGGVVHWTHHDPQGRRPGGWIRHAGRLYR